MGTGWLSYPQLLVAKMRFTIQPEVILSHVEACPDAGGFVCFEGRVRNEHLGKDVVALEYEAHPEMAIAQGEQLLAEAIERFRLIDAVCVHRVGRLDVGELAVKIDVSAAHRREAFAGCEFIIDELKKRVPIWKKEHYADGNSGWIGIQEQPVTVDSVYDRQMRLPEVGVEGQNRLRQARVLVVGAGGLGCAAIPYLVAAGVGTVGICDGERVHVSNLHRQPMYGPGDIGLLKVDRVAVACGRLSPFVQVNAYPEQLTVENAEGMVKGYDIVIDGTDNFRTKFVLNRTCTSLGKPLIVAGIYKFDGQLLVIVPRGSGGCLRCVWPTEPTDGRIGTCADVGVLGFVPGLFGVQQAAEAIKLILGLPSAATSNVVVQNLLDGTQVLLPRAVSPDCPICSGIATVSD